MWSLISSRLASSAATGQRGGGLPLKAHERSRWHDGDRWPRLLVSEPGEAVEHFAELGELDGLGEVCEHAAGQQAVDDAAGGVGGKDDHGNGGGGRVGLEFVEYLVSLEVGQVQVEQNDVRHIPDGALQAGGRDVDQVGGAGEADGESRALTQD